MEMTNYTHTVTISSAVNGFKENIPDDELLSEIDQMVASDNEELTSLKLQITRYRPSSGIIH